MLLHAMSLFPLSSSFILGKNALFSRKFYGSCLPHLTQSASFVSFTTICHLLCFLTFPKLLLISHPRPPYTNLSSLTAFLLHYFISVAFSTFYFGSPHYFSVAPVIGSIHLPHHLNPIFLLHFLYLNLWPKRRQFQLAMDCEYCLVFMFTYIRMTSSTGETS